MDMRRCVCRLLASLLIVGRVVRHLDDQILVLDG